MVLARIFATGLDCFSGNGSQQKGTCFQPSFWAARAVRPRYLIEFDDGEELQVGE